MRGRIRVAVRMAIEAGHAEMRAFTAPVVGQVELLLRERRDQETQPLELLRIQDAVEEREEVLRRDELTLRNVSELGPCGQVDRRRKLGKKVLGHVEVDVEAVQIPLLLRENLVDVMLREYHSAFFLERVRQRLEAFREEIALADLRAGHRGQLVP